MENKTHELRQDKRNVELCRKIKQNDLEAETRLLNTFLVTIPFDRLQQDMGTKAVSSKENRNDRSLTGVLTEVLSVRDAKKVMPIAEYLDIHGEITPKEAELLVRKSTKTVYRYMTMLVRTGKVVREGETNKAVYRLIK